MPVSMLYANIFVAASLQFVLFGCKSEPSKVKGASKKSKRKKTGDEDNEDAVDTIPFKSNYPLDSPWRFVDPDHSLSEKDVIV